MWTDCGNLWLLCVEDNFHNTNTATIAITITVAIFLYPNSGLELIHRLRAQHADAGALQRGHGVVHILKP
ncbi:MAG TPA: hypothetical protein PLB42_09565, partial [Kiritimatiellia bacterium]|nr:hypothetical protein [Kiritimatiellia bacterium]